MKFKQLKSTDHPKSRISIISTTKDSVCLKFKQGDKEIRSWFLKKHLHEFIEEINKHNKKFPSYCKN